MLSSEDLETKKGMMEQSCFVHEVRYHIVISHVLLEHISTLFKSIVSLQQWSVCVRTCIRNLHFCVCPCIFATMSLQRTVCVCVNLYPAFQADRAASGHVLHLQIDQHIEIHS